MSSSANAPIFTLTLDGVADDFPMLAFDGRWNHCCSDPPFSPGSG
ncbi:hypothetical protein RCF34_11615 [Pseudomonas sp. 102515]|nr:hypothetical protein [Pseudomonas sp. 102515]MDQ7913749.1 hypothetical protein [Pseudomonas sp. 102515]